MVNRVQSTESTADSSTWMKTRKDQQRTESFGSPIRSLQRTTSFKLPFVATMVATGDSGILSRSYRSIGICRRFCFFNSLQFKAILIFFSYINHIHIHIHIHIHHRHIVATVVLGTQLGDEGKQLDAIQVVMQVIV